MRRLVVASLCIAACARPVAGPSHAPTAAVVRGPSRIQLDTFVLSVRDMAAWAIVTPAAHIPVGGLLSAAGSISSVTDNAGAMPAPTPDTVVSAFRELLSAAARRQQSTIAGLGYLVRRVPPGGRSAVDAVLVEVESVSGYRADVLWPYTKNEFGEPQFAKSYTLPGTMRVYGTGAATPGASPR
ncbi:MAG: hypothetical protein H7099_08760 [Gemmatimonadaceae bacterium]|nr:hypothetical protein [Gemmatimonadaceae bacterium]